MAVSMARWDSIRDLDMLQRSVQQLFRDRLMQDAGDGPMALDVYETADEVVVRADLPGVQPEDIQVSHHGGQVVIRARRMVDAPEGARWLLRQTTAGDLVQSVGLPVPVDLDGVQAQCSDGILELRLPKAEHARPRTIPVRPGSTPRRRGRATGGPEAPNDPTNA